MADIKKRVRLEGGEEVTLRSLTKGDERALLEFFREIPAESRIFLKEDVTDPAVVKRWVNNLEDQQIIPIVALHDGQIVGDATLHRSNHGWSEHVAEVRVVVAEKWRRKGIAQALIRELVGYAATMDIEILEARVLQGQPDAQRVFEALGFKVETVLRNQAKDQKGQRRNVLLLTHDVTDLWDHMRDLILELEYIPRG